MSRKNLDGHGRLRSVTVAFRVSPEEGALLDSLVSLSGLTKQDYIVARLLERDVVVKPNSRLRMAVQRSTEEVLFELRRIDDASRVSPELCETVAALARVFDGLGDGRSEPCGSESPGCLISELGRS